MSMTDEKPAATADSEMVPPTEYEKAVSAEEVPDGGRTPLDWFRANAGLFVQPAIIVLLGFLLYRYVKGAEDDFSVQRALRWDVILRPQLQQHLSLTLWSTLFVILIAVPLGIFLTRPQFKAFTGPILAFATSGQAIPAFGLVVLSLAWLGSGPWTVVWALTLFTILPVLRNTIVGLEQVSKPVIEAGRGMGLTKGQALRQIELPLAVPVILAGVRTALVINVGMAALAFLIRGGGLGITIDVGIKLARTPILVTGAALTALVALSVDWIAALIEKALRPKGL